MLSAHQITKSFQNNLILKEVSFSVNPGERVGLIGPNGCGKTTLLRILAGIDRPDSGHLNLVPSGLRLGYLPQGFVPAADATLQALIQEATNDPAFLEARLTRITAELVSNPGQPDLQSAYDEVLMRLQEPFDPGRLAAILTAFDLDTLPQDQLAATLSGGQKTRFSLALVLLSDPQLLLLDEPTNHLDISMLEWLEDWLNDYQGTALIVTHDRTFLEQTVTRILALDPATQTARSYDGSYSDYIEQVTREHEKQMATYNDQAAEIRRMRGDIQRTRSQAERTEREASSIRIGGGMMKLKGYKDYQQGIAKKVARKAKSREKKLERYLDSDERVEKPKASWQIKLEFNQPAHLGRDVLAIEDLTIGYPGHAPLIEDLSLYVQSGKRIAFTGPNGSGKTTLLRTIAGRMPALGGSFRLGSSVKLGYMSQEQGTLDPDATPVEVIQAASRFNHTENRTFLHYYLFGSEDVLRPVGSLSYGERSRLMLARLVASGCNFLLLDEPINHLDIPSRERFEQALSGFEGTILAVVHDRFFIQRFATDLWVLEGGGIHQTVLALE